MTEKSPGDFTKALDGKRWEQAPTPDATGGMIRFLGVAWLAFGIVIAYSFVWGPIRDVLQGATSLRLDYRTIVGTPIILGMGFWLMLGGRHAMAVSPSRFRWGIALLLLAGAAIAIGVRMFAASRGYVF